MIIRRWALGLVLMGCGLVSTPAFGEQAEASKMTADRLATILLRVDKKARIEDNVIEFEIQQYPVVMVFDETADRMRLMSPVGKIEDMDEAEMLRLMQANFDSALDARYAVANDILWGLFVHPLSTLTEEEFLVAIGQTINVVVTFGKSYSSGVFVYGGGDSSGIERRKLIDQLKDLVKT
ncbi:MAG: type III secretion system chaperone [Gammaproteobacteria bacterium]